MPTVGLEFVAGDFSLTAKTACLQHADCADHEAVDSFTPPDSGLRTQEVGFQDCHTNRQIPLGSAIGWEFGLGTADPPLIASVNL